MDEVMVAYFIIGGFLYFVPSMYAFTNRVKGRKGILLLNIFTGWTFFGWVGSMIWAVLAKKNCDE